MNELKTPGSQQEAAQTLSSKVIESPHEEVSPFVPWSEEEIRNARPRDLPRPPQQLRHDEAQPQVKTWPSTFVPPDIGITPYDAMCKIIYRNGGVPFVASGWIVQGNTGKGIITSGHVVYDNGRWSRDYLVLRQYSNGHWREEFRGSFARTLHGWIHGHGSRVYWDLGAIIPDNPIPDSTPALPFVSDYNPTHAPFNFYYDTGYPAKPANGYPFDGSLLWESDGSLFQVHAFDDQLVLEAYNAMEQGSSGSPWLIYNAFDGLHYAAGMQSSGWDNVPTAYSPCFSQRNIGALLRDIGIQS